MPNTKSIAGFLMSRIRHLGGRASERYLSACGIDAFNGPQGRILYVLWENGRMTITQIGRQTSLAKTTLTSMLDRMEKGCLIHRVPDERDRRKTHIELTEKARALKGAYDAYSDWANELYYKGFTRAEVTRLEGYLQRILANIEAYQSAPKSKEEYHADELDD